MITLLLTHVLDECRAQLAETGLELRPPLMAMKAGSTAAKDRKVNFLVFDSEHPEPVIILKLSRTGAYEKRLRHEFETLQRVSEIRHLRHTIPLPIAMTDFQDHVVMVEKCLPGLPLTVLLRRHKRTRPNEIEEDLIHALDWLQLLQRETRSDIGAIDVYSLIEDRLDNFYQLYGETALPQRFVAELRDRTQAWPKLQVPLTACHGDFWPGNFLVSEGQIGVIDWESYSDHGVPFLDAFLFLTSYARVYPWSGWKWGNRKEAFFHSFLKQNRFSQILLRSFQHYLRCLELPVTTASLFFPLFLLEMSLPLGEFDRDQAQATRWMEWLRLFAEHENQSIFGLREAA